MKRFAIIGLAVALVMFMGVSAYALEPKPIGLTGPYVVHQYVTDFTTNGGGGVRWSADTSWGGGFTYNAGQGYAVAAQNPDGMILTAWAPGQGGNPGTDPTLYNIVGGSFVITDYSSTGGTPADIGGYISFAGWGNNGIQMTVTPLGGNSYDLSFDLSSTDLSLGMTVGAMDANNWGAYTGWSAYPPSAMYVQSFGPVLNNEWTNGVTVPSDAGINTSFTVKSITLDVAEPTPEPISMIFFGTGLVAVGGYVSRRRMARKA